jgi:hypothetical protein
MRGGQQRNRPARTCVRHKVEMRPYVADPATGDILTATDSVVH